MGYGNNCYSSFVQVLLFFKVFGEFGTSDVLNPPLLEMKIYTEPKKKTTTNLFVWTRVSCKDSKYSSLLGLSGGWLQCLELLHGDEMSRGTN